MLQSNADSHVVVVVDADAFVDAAVVVAGGGGGLIFVFGG